MPQKVFLSSVFAIKKALFYAKNQGFFVLRVSLKISVLTSKDENAYIF